MLGIWGSQSSPSKLGLPTLSEGGCLSQKPAFFPKSMERILWLYNWKSFLLKDSRWHVTARSEMGLAFCVTCAEQNPGHSWYLLECRLFCPTPSGQHGREWGILSFPRVLLCLSREPLVSVLPVQHYSQVCHC